MNLVPIVVLVVLALAVVYFAKNAIVVDANGNYSINWKHGLAALLALGGGAFAWLSGLLHLGN